MKTLSKIIDSLAARILSREEYFAWKVEQLFDR